MSLTRIGAIKISNFYYHCFVNSLLSFVRAVSFFPAESVKTKLITPLFQLAYTTLTDESFHWLSAIWPGFSTGI